MAAPKVFTWSSEPQPATFLHCRLCPNIFEPPPVDEDAPEIYGYYKENRLFPGDFITLCPDCFTTDPAVQIVLAIQNGKDV